MWPPWCVCTKVCVHQVMGMEPDFSMWSLHECAVSLVSYILACAACMSALGPWSHGFSVELT